MAWTAPKTWTAGEMVTFALLNTYQRDNMVETEPAKASAKGDLFAATGANAIAVQAPGADDEALSTLASESNGLTTVVVASITSGLVAPFTAACPTGWTEVTTTRGRFLVGAPNGSGDADIGGTQGTALTNLENKTHTHDHPAHGHTWATSATTTSGTDKWVESPLPNAGAITTDTASMGDYMPYVQLRFCSKD